MIALLLMLMGSLTAVYIQVPPGPEPIACGPSVDPWNTPSHVLKEDDTLWYMGPGER